MSVTDSAANFAARALALGLEATVLQAVVDSGVDTMAKFAFSSSYVPGQTDEAPFIDAVSSMLGRGASVGELAVLRRLLHECFALTSAELKQSVERTEDAPTKRLAQPDRADRRERQQKRLKGMAIQGFREPSDRLVDKAVSLYEENRLTYIPLTSCTSKDAEVKSQATKEDKHLVIDAVGNVKLRNQPEKLEADVSSDLLIQYALERRGLALDQANVLDYELHDRWIAKLMDARYRDPPPSYARVSHHQLLSADKELFVRLAELTPEGIQMSGTTRPCDKCFMDAVNSAVVQHLLQPLPVASASTKTVALADEAWQEKGKGKGKGGKKGQPRVPGVGVGVPQALKHGVSSTGKGNPICFDHNLGKCTRPVKMNRCQRGLHICCMKGCFSTSHVYTNCPKKPADE